MHGYRLVIIRSSDSPRKVESTSINLSRRMVWKATQTDAEKLDRYALMLCFRTQPAVSEGYVHRAKPASESRLGGRQVSTKQRANKAEQDEMFSEFARLTSRYSSGALFYIAGDFNSQLEYRKHDEKFNGKHSRGRRNINGIALADFLEALVLFVCNTSFQHPARHKTTWQ